MCHSLLISSHSAPLRKEGWLSDRSTPAHSLPYDNTHPPGSGAAALGFGISATAQFLAGTPRTAAPGTYVCTTGCLGAWTCQDFRAPLQTLPAAGQGDAVRRSPSAARTGHPPPEPLAWDTSEGTTREIDPSRDTAWHPWPAAWGHAGQTQTRVVTALPGVHSVAARPGKESVPK